MKICRVWISAPKVMQKYSTSSTKWKIEWKFKLRKWQRKTLNAKTIWSKLKLWIVVITCFDATKKYYVCFVCWFSWIKKEIITGKKKIFEKKRKKYEKRKKCSHGKYSTLKQCGNDQTTTVWKSKWSTKFFFSPKNNIYRKPSF